ncbi:aminotransferase class V-fold PLP-dependent enzyme [Amycolatopsis thermalba]|uniref:aminotransferase class V-fold PLP-dependent enzyme n=1 Tax=Amycolatopsis thermalba TaxID=944492 RepID=UPI000E226A02|nr:aminotransferase class V-fold PLP-dependent enzyme [Amycolatopsis thermalba]
MRTAFGADFDVPTGYLNTPSIGIPPAAVADAVAASVEAWRTGGNQPGDFEPLVARARESFARLVGVPSGRIAIGSTVSQLLASVAAGLPEGARVLTAAGEFTSTTFPFAARGARITEVRLAELPGAVRGHDLVTVSVAQSADGALVDLGALRAEAEAAGVPVVLDATQAAGWMPLDLEWADWVVAAGYKWLMSPRGCAWLAVHPRVAERTVPVSANWYAGEDPWQTTYGMPLRLAGGARRVDLSPVWFAHAGAEQRLPYLASLDLAAVRAHNVELADALLTRLGLPGRGSAIVALAADPAALTQAGVTASVRAGKARVGFHLYNTEDDVERVLDALR